MISETPAWQALQQHWDLVSGDSIAAQFARDPRRCERFSRDACGIHLDYSKNLLRDETLGLLAALADSADLASWKARLLAGEAVNNTEDRAVLHMALRNQGGRAYRVGGVDVMPDIRAVLARMRDFSERVRDGRWLGHSGRRITDVVSLGIGGSSLGPRMACDALRPYQTPTLRVHFVSNVDGADLAQTLAPLDPQTTLFVVASKTFTTQETLTNAESARSWCVDGLGDRDAVARHFVAVSTNREAVSAFGIDPQNMFGFWDWVGGRYSVWSAIGLPLALAIGMERFDELLAGAHAMDEHFIAAPVLENLPVILALLGVWYNNFGDIATHAIIPYDQNLRDFPTYLQQVDMESNGKRVTREGQPIGYATGPVVWGQPGTDAQHSFFQLIHQGTRLVPVDFIVPLRSHYRVGDHHAKLVANAFAQAQALMRGRSADEARAELAGAGMPPDRVEALVPHRVFPGNRPSNTLLVEQVTPRVLGALIALYEHKVFVQGVIWGLDSFDQWGVELGKQLAGRILCAFGQSESVDAMDGSTTDLIGRYLAARADSSR